MSGAARPPVSLPNSEMRVLRADDGGEYRILVAWPAEPPPPAGHPALFLLDANASFGTLVESVRMRSGRTASTGVVPAVVVGVGYPVDGPYDRARRTLDFTSAAPVETPDGEPATAHATGGARRFHEFLDDVVRPAIARDLPLDPRRQTLVGHSLGALFVLESLLRAPGDFGGYVAISPSLWWDRERLLAGADALAARGADADVVVAIGEYEQDVAPWQRGAGEDAVARLARRRAERRMVDDARAFADRLAAGRRGPRVRFDLVPGEDHASVFPVALSRALRAVLAPA